MLNNGGPCLPHASMCRRCTVGLGSSIRQCWLLHEQAAACTSDENYDNKVVIVIAKFAAPHTLEHGASALLVRALPRAIVAKGKGCSCTGARSIPHTGLAAASPCR